MGNKHTLNLIITTQENIYSPGSIVKGSVCIYAPKAYPIKNLVLQIQGQQKCEFEERKACSKLIDTSFVIKTWEKNSVLTDNYEFPFSFRLPNHIPGTFKQIRSDYKAQIRYTLTTICTPWRSDFKSVQYLHELQICQPQIKQNEPLYGQIFLFPSTCYRKRGVIKISCYFENNHYSSGKQCIIVCQADNYKSDLPISRINCQLIKNLKLTSNKGIVENFRQVIRSVDFPGLAPHTSYTEALSESRSIQLTYKKKQQISPSIKGAFVECEYFIQVNTKINGTCCLQGQQSFKVPLIVLQNKMEIQPILKPEDWQPEIYHPSEIILNPKIQSNQQMLNPYNLE